MQTTAKQKLILLIFSIGLALFLLELGLRIGGVIFLSFQEYRNKLSMQQKGSYRILCLGESTTAMRGNDSYPRQLEKILNQQNSKITFSVINKGVPGTDTEAIAEGLRDNLAKYKPDMVITMMGINDRMEDAIPREDLPPYNAAKLIRSFRVYKLVNLLKLHIISRLKKGGLCMQERKNKDMLAAAGIHRPIRRNQASGTDFLKQRKYKKAEKVYEEIIKANPDDDKAYLELGMSYWFRGRPSEAEEMYKKSIEINPENDTAYCMLGMRYRHQKKYSKAEEMYEKAIEINPRKEWPYGDLGRCYMYQTDYAKAERILKAAIELNPKKDRTYALLASCYRRWGKDELADEYFRKANIARIKYYNPVTQRSYRRLRDILKKNDVKLLCVQYPMRTVKSLRKMFNDTKDVGFVDNEMVFKKAVAREGFDEYFTDEFGGDFGHCTPKGNRLLAENIAKFILRKALKR